MTRGRTVLGWRPEQAAAIGLAAFGLIERVGLWLAYAPASFGDTPSYFRLAAAIREFGLGAYDASRVPGYPGFLALLGEQPQTVWAAQMALGWAISLMLFWLGWKTTGRLGAGLAAGMLYNLLPGLVLFEANLLSETLTAFLVVASLALWEALDRMVRGRSGSAADGRALDRDLVVAGLLGVCTAAAGMVRPLFFLLPAWLFFWVLALPARARAERIGRAIAFGIGPVLILGGWLNWMRSTYGMFSPTSMTGYHLVQHTGEYFEDLPDEVAPIRDTYLKYRDARIAERGVQTNAIWDAIPEMTEASGLNFFSLSIELQRLSLWLIARNPGLYLANVVEGWIDFWKAPVYWDRESVAATGLASLIAGWAAIGRGLALVANAAFLMASVVAVALPWWRRRLGIDRFAWVAGGLIWLSSIVQTLVDHGDNPRFLVPLQAVVVLLVVRAGWTAWRGAEEP